MNNIEEKIIAWLTANVPEDWPVSGDVPEDKPDKFIIVERTGGGVVSERLEQPDITIRFYNKKSAAEASNLAIETDIKLRREIPQVRNISKVQRLSLVRLDDLVIKYPTYQAYYSFVHLI
jgi:hypothetical protein